MQTDAATVNRGGAGQRRPRAWKKARSRAGSPLEYPQQPAVAAFCARTTNSSHSPGPTRDREQEWAAGDRARTGADHAHPPKHGLFDLTDNRNRD